MKRLAGFVKKLAPGGQMPSRKYDGDAGFDLHYSGDEPIHIPPLEYADVECGVAIEWPPKMWGLVVGRSSTFRSKGLMVNPGIIDAGFRGELFAVVRNITVGPVVVNPGERVAQIIPMPLLAYKIDMSWARKLSESDRGTNGFGSTGT